MKRIYINSRQAEESRIIVAEDGKLVGFEQNTVGSENKKGDIYKGVVTRVEESLDAAFVDFGESKDGFLPFKYIAPNLPGATGPDGTLAEGDSILVQIKKDHVSDKGAGLTTFITLAGSYLVLRPNQPSRVLMSKQIDNHSRHQSAQALKALTLPEGMGAILRSAGQNRTAAELQWDLESYLLKLWDAITTAAGAHNKPILIYRENNFLLRAVRDYFTPETDEIYCDNAEDCAELKSFLSLLMTDGAARVHHHDGEEPLTPADLETQIDDIYQRKVKTRSGATLVFDSTEALVAIDVNSAQIRGAGDNIEQTALQTNLEAAEVIARQLRLRDLAGLIVVDFIDMVDEKNCAKLSDRFSALLRQDRARVQWSPLSRFCMMEISRQRLSRSVEATQTLLCPSCHGTGRQWKVESFSLRLLRHLQETAQRTDAHSLLVRAPTETAFYLLNEKRAELRRLEDAHHCEIVIAPMASMHPPDFSIRNFGKGKTAEAVKPTESKDQQYADRERMRLQERQRRPQHPLLKTFMPTQRAPQTTRSQKTKPQKRLARHGEVSLVAKILNLIGSFFAPRPKPSSNPKPHRNNTPSGNGKKRHKPMVERKARTRTEPNAQTRDANGPHSKRRRHPKRRKNGADPMPQQPPADDHNIAPIATPSPEVTTAAKSLVTPPSPVPAMVESSPPTASTPQKDEPPTEQTDSPTPKAESPWFEPEQEMNDQSNATTSVTHSEDNHLATAATPKFATPAESSAADNQINPPPLSSLVSDKSLQMIETAATETTTTKMIIDKKELTAATTATTSPQPPSMSSPPMRQIESRDLTDTTERDKLA